MAFYAITDTLLEGVRLRGLGDSVLQLFNYLDLSITYSFVLPALSCPLLVMSTNCRSSLTSWPSLWWVCPRLWWTMSKASESHGRKHQRAGGEEEEREDGCLPIWDSFLSFFPARPTARLEAGCQCLCCGIVCPGEMCSQFLVFFVCSFGKSSQQRQ